VPAKPRILLALLFLAVGVFVLPFVPLASDTVNWQLLANAYTDIFADGFEDGTTDRWSATVNGSTAKVLFPHGSQIAEEILLSMDKSGRCRVPKALLLELGVDKHSSSIEPTTQVDDCWILIAEEGVIITFQLPQS